MRNMIEALREFSAVGEGVQLMRLFIFGRKTLSTKCIVDEKHRNRSNEEGQRAYEGAKIDSSALN